MQDIFDNAILCQNCNKKMQKTQFEKNGFVLRAVVCDKCGEKIIHPVDLQEYQKYVDLKKREFRVKMRMVGNSYTVSIPREIVSFMEHQKEMMNNMVKMCFEDMGRLSLNFGKNFENNEEGKNQTQTRVVKAREYKIMKNNKPVLHVKQFADSADPKNNKTQVFRNTGMEKEK